MFAQLKNKEKPREIWKAKRVKNVNPSPSLTPAAVEP